MLSRRGSKTRLECVFNTWPFAISSEIADEPFCSLLFITHFYLVNIGISWTSSNLSLYIFELAFQSHKACSNQRPRTLDMIFLEKVITRKNIGVRMEFRWHCRWGSRKFLFIKLVQTGLQMRLQTRLSGKIEFFERLGNLSSRLNGGTFDHHFAYRITPTKTYTLKQLSAFTFADSNFC